jgi:hypothetical protein
MIKLQIKNKTHFQKQKTNSRTKNTYPTSERKTNNKNKEHLTNTQYQRTRTALKIKYQTKTRNNIKNKQRKST